MKQPLTWLAGARPEILAECPTERPKYTGIGAAILITASIAAVSLTFALVTALKVAWWAAIPFAIAWGLAIFSLDRWLVVSLQRQEKRRNYLFLALPRLFLALLFGMVISTPFVLQIFRPEIEHQITILQDRAAGTYYRQLPHSPLSKEITADQARVAALNATISNGGPGANLAGNKALQSLIAQRNQAQKKENADYNEWQCQLYGVPPAGGTKCPPGNGQLAQASRQSYEADKAQVQQDNAQIGTMEARLLGAGKAQQARAKSQAAAELPTAEQKLRVDRAEQQQQTDAFTANNRNDTGLLIRLQALDAATAGSSTLTAARWLLFLLFTTIECLPMLVKVLLNLGPENTYEKMLAAEENLRLRIAAHKRSVRQAAGNLLADTILEETQSRLTGWTTEIPELTQDIVAARRRVEKKRLSTWEQDQARRIKQRLDAPLDDVGLGVEPPVGYFPEWLWAETLAQRRRGSRSGNGTAQEGPSHEQQPWVPVPAQPEFEDMRPTPEWQVWDMDTVSIPGNTPVPPGNGSRRGLAALWERAARNLGLGRRAREHPAEGEGSLFADDGSGPVPLDPD